MPPKLLATRKHSQENNSQPCSDKHKQVGFKQPLYSNTFNSLVEARFVSDRCCYATGMMSNGFQDFTFTNHTAFPWKLSNYKISPTTRFPWKFFGDFPRFPKIPTYQPCGAPKIPPIQLCDLIGRIDGVKEDLIDFGPENKKTRFPKGGISQHGETSETCGIFSYRKNIYMYIYSNYSWWLNQPLWTNMFVKLEYVPMKGWK